MTNALDRGQLGREIGHRRTGKAGSQRAIVKLLEESPLPWTIGMLKDWFGHRGNGILDQARWMQRIRRVAPGVYTSASKYVKPVSRRKASTGPRVLVTDDMLARFGFNL